MCFAQKPNPSAQMEKAKEVKRRAFLCVAARQGDASGPERIAARMRQAPQRCGWTRRERRHRRPTERPAVHMRMHGADGRQGRCAVAERRRVAEAKAQTLTECAGREMPAPTADPAGQEGLHGEATGPERNLPIVERAGRKIRRPYRMAGEVAPAFSAYGLAPKTRRRSPTTHQALGTRHQAPISASTRPQSCRPRR